MAVSISRAIRFFLLTGLLWGFMGCGKQAPDKPATKPQSSTAETADASGKTPPKPKPTEEPSSPAKEEPPADNRTVSDDPKAQLQADLEDAIAVLEQGNVALFIERYMPLEYVQNIREFSTVEQMAKNIKIGGLFEKEWLEKLRALQHAEIEFLDQEKSRASLLADVSPKDTSPANFSLTDPAEEKIPPYEGFPGELQEAIGQAIASLEAGEHQKFVENLFPESELHITQSEEKLQALWLRLKEHPAMVERMVADLKSLQQLAPEFDAEKVTATFQLNPDTPQARTIQFEKVETWRMANTAKRIRADVYKQSLQPPIGYQAQLEIEWERIRDHWRLAKTK